MDLRMAGAALRTSPVAVGLGQAALAGGLSAYGNLAEENDRNKGDQRMILESALAALGGGIAAAKARSFMNRNAAPIVQQATQYLAARNPQVLDSARSAYQGSRLLRSLPPEAWVGLAGTSAAAAIGAGIAGGNVAPFVSDQLGLVGIPGAWTRRANDWNWDRQTEAEQRIAEEVLARLQGEEAA